jgi:hypothetical protein
MGQVATANPSGLSGARPEARCGRQEMTQATVLYGSRL